MLTNNKKLKEILKHNSKLGWVFKLGSRHIKGVHTTGRTVTISRTPGDGRAIENISRDLIV
jgi:hypothetical protein